jgi:Fe-S cluster assembly iron-binding protein IscA
VLTVSQSAAEAILLLVEHSDAPESAGIRITAGAPTDHGTPLALELVDGPHPDDEVVADGEASVFLEPQVAPYLADSVLEAHVDDGEVAFALRDNDRDNDPSERPSHNGAGPH